MEDTAGSNKEERQVCSGNFHPSDMMWKGSFLKWSSEVTTQEHGSKNHVIQRLGKEDASPVRTTAHQSENLRVKLIRPPSEDTNS